MAKRFGACLMFWCLVAGCGGGGGKANGGGKGGASGAGGNSGIAGGGGKAGGGPAGSAGAANTGIAGAPGSAGGAGTAGSSGSAGNAGGGYAGTADAPSPGAAGAGASGGGDPPAAGGATSTGGPVGSGGVSGSGGAPLGGSGGAPPSDLSGDPVGIVLAEASIQVTAAQQVISVGPARVTIPAGALPVNATLILRLLSGVVKPGGAPIRGLTMQFAPTTPAPALPLVLELPSPGPAAYEAISAAEAAPAWTREGSARIASGYVVVGVPHFSLWSASPSGPIADWLEEDPLATPAVSSLFAGLQSAAPASLGGGVELRFPAAMPSARRYLLFVRPQGGTYNFQRAYAVVFPDHINYVGGLATEQTWCFTVRFDGDANTTEACATPAITPPQPDLPVFAASTTPPWTDSALDLTWTVRTGAGYRYDLERRSNGGTYETRASTTTRATLLAPSDGSSVSFTDLADAPGPYDFRVRAFADGVETGLSAVKTINVVKKAWRQPLERAPRLVSGPALKPRVTVGGDGRLVYGEYASAAPAPQFLAGMRKASSVRQGPAISGSPEPWRRLLDAYDDIGVVDPMNQWLGWARGADGTLWVLDSSQALLKVGSSGAGQIWNTAIHDGAFNVVAHPTDPAKLAVAGANGVWVTSDGGVTFRLFGDVTGVPVGVAYAPNGTLFAVGTHLAQSTDNGLSWFNYGSWPTPTDPPGEIAISPDGSLMAVSLPSALPRSGVWVGAPGGVLTYSDVGLSSDHLWAADGLTFLPDNRLVLVLTSSDGGDAARPAALACVRSPGGAWTTFELPGPWVADGAPQPPVLFDLRPGHEDDDYYARLRTRDGGVTWELNPAGRAVGATTSGAELVLLTVQQPDAALPATSYRSTDGGDTATSLPGVALPVDGSIWFNPASPLVGVTSAGTYTTDGGATWTPSTMGAAWAGAGFADAGHVIGTSFNASPLRSTDGGASFAPFDGTKSNTVCGNGAQALVVRSASGNFLSYTSTAQEIVTNTAIPGAIRGCGLADGAATVYLLTSSTLWKGKAGIGGSLSRLPLSATATTSGPTPLIVSPDGMKVSARGSYSDTGGE